MAVKLQNQKFNLALMFKTISHFFSKFMLFSCYFKIDQCPGRIHFELFLIGCTCVENVWANASV